MAEVAPVAPVETPAPALPSGVVDDTAKWAELAEEIEGKPEAPEEPAAPTEPEAPATIEPAQHAEPTLEQLKTNYTNVQKALQQERLQRQAYEQRLQNYDDFIKQLRESKQQAAKPEAEAPKAPKAPSRDEDPIGYFEHKISELQGQLQQATQGTQLTAQQFQEQQQWNQLWGTVQQAETAIKDPKSPTYKADYDEACEHLEKGRIRELERMYPDNSPQAQQMAAQHRMTPQQLRIAILNQDRTAVAMQALQMGVSPAEFYYNLSQDRGYQPKASNVVPLKPQEAAQAKIEAARRGVKAAKTISGTGSKQQDDLTIADLTSLWAEDPEEFDRMWDKMAKAGQLG